MADKNNGKWTKRIAVQKAFDRDPQNAYNAVNSVITRQQAAEIEALLFPPPSSEEAAAEAVAELTAMKEALEKHGLDTAEVDSKLAEIVAA